MTELFADVGPRWIWALGLVARIPGRGGGPERAGVRAGARRTAHRRFGAVRAVVGRARHGVGVVPAPRHRPAGDAPVGAAGADPAVGVRGDGRARRDQHRGVRAGRAWQLAVAGAEAAARPRAPGARRDGGRAGLLVRVGQGAQRRARGTRRDVDCRRSRAPGAARQPVLRPDAPDGAARSRSATTSKSRGPRAWSRRSTGGRRTSSRRVASCRSCRTRR